MTPRSPRGLRLHCVIALSVTSSGTNCVQVHHPLPLQADSRSSRSSFVPSRVTRSQLSSAARERHVSIVGASERASALYPFENYCLQISAYCAPWDGQEFRQIVYLSALRPGIRGTFSLAAGSRLRAERYLLQQNQYFEYLIWIRRTAGS